MTQPYKIEWTDVDSSNVQSVAYDPESKILAVHFHGDRLYSYDDVQDDVYVAMVHAESVGKYLNQMIRGRYGYRQWFSEQELIAHMMKR
jgi:hypothetical protein